MTFCALSSAKGMDIKMIVLGILVLLLAGYLVYALIHPEKL
ncbi:K(+)-transporting ATPase subunit F [Mediterraneibacter gnavus]